MEQATEPLAPASRPKLGDCEVRARVFFCVENLMHVYEINPGLNASQLPVVIMLTA
jgi:hypothetical protein